MEQKAVEKVSVKEVLDRLRNTPKDELKLNMEAYAQCMMKFVEDFNERLSQIKTAYKDYFSILDTGIVMGLAMDGQEIATVVCGDQESVGICIGKLQKATKECANA